MGTSQIDLTSLNQLTALFNALLQAFLPIVLIVTFVGFIVVLVGGSVLLGRVIILKFSGEPAQTRTSRRKGMKTVIIGLFLLLTLTMAFAPAGAETAAIGISVGTTQIFANVPVTITASDLVASTAYGIVYDGDLADSTLGTVLFNWTTATVPVDVIITTEALASSAGNDVVIILQASADGTTSASVTVYMADPNDFFPTTFIITLGIAMVIIGVITVVVVAIVARRV